MTQVSRGKTWKPLRVLKCAVFSTKPMDKDSPIDWVELKTSACIENDKDMLKYERKLQKFWIQSFLLGVPRIIVGFRTKRGILHHTEELETKTIPGFVKRSGKGSWDGNVCINFTAAFLECMLSFASLPVGLIRRRAKADNYLRRCVEHSKERAVRSY